MLVFINVIITTMQHDLWCISGVRVWPYGSGMLHNSTLHIAVSWCFSQCNCPDYICLGIFWRKSHSSSVWPLFRHRRLLDDESSQRWWVEVTYIHVHVYNIQLFLKLIYKWIDPFYTVSGVKQMHKLVINRMRLEWSEYHERPCSTNNRKGVA